MIAPCTVVWSSRAKYWAVLIPRCPLCGRKHYHGGGDGPEPDLGWRASHCAEFHESYFLVETAVSLAARQAKPGPSLPYACIGPECAVRIGHQIHRCSGCEEATA